LKPLAARWLATQAGDPAVSEPALEVVTD
jgi:hypothetical protein